MDEEDIDALIGRNLRRLRDARGMSQLDLGKIMGMDKSKISGYENGHIVMGKEKMMLFCDALKVRPWEFYVEDSTPIVSGEKEWEALYLIREAEKLNVAEDISGYGRFRVDEAKKKGAIGGESASKRVPRHSNKKA